MFSAISFHTNKNLAKIKATQSLILFFIVLSALATSVADSSINAIATKKKIKVTVKAAKLISAKAIPSSPKSPTTEASVYTWGHNIKYSSILFHEDIIVAGFTLLDVKYPKNDDFDVNGFTIIGIFAECIDKLDSAAGRNLTSDLSVNPIKGGIGFNFTTIEFVSLAPNDVKCNLKITGVNV